MLEFFELFKLYLQPYLFLWYKNHKQELQKYKHPLDYDYYPILNILYYYHGNTIHYSFQPQLQYYILSFLYYLVNIRPNAMLETQYINHLLQCNHQVIYGYLMDIQLIYYHLKLNFTVNIYKMNVNNFMQLNYELQC